MFVDCSSTDQVHPSSAMDNQDIEASLHSIIGTPDLPLQCTDMSDPDHETIQALQAVQTQDEFPPPASPLDPPPATDTATPDGSSSSKASKAKRERKVVIRGSEADLRRREANRMAADRSRSRAKERQAQIESTSKALSEEKARLEAEIAQLESQSSSARTLGQHSIESASGMPNEAPEFAGTGNEAQDSHSRTILAALMSAGSVNEVFGGADGDDDAWMQGVEDMFKEAESSGRLSELAALAMGRNGPTGQQGPVDTQVAALEEVQELPEDRVIVATEPDQGANVDEPVEPVESVAPLNSEEVRAAPDTNVNNGKASKFHKVEYSSTDAAAQTASAMAVLLNAEMERFLRDDIVASKAAITTVNKECERVKQLQETLETLAESDLVERDRVRINALPDMLLSVDVDSIMAETKATEEKIAALEASLPEIRESVKKIIEEKLQHESLLAAGVSELQGVLESGTEGKESIVKLLKSITGYVAHLLHGSPDDVSFDHVSECLDQLTTQTHKSAHPASTLDNFSSPAIAHRRRGRPPVKSSLVPSQPGDTEQPEGTVDLPSITAEDINAAIDTNGRAASSSSANKAGDQSPAAAQSTARQRAHHRRLLQKLSQVSYPQEPESNHTEEIAPTPEQYILSHLQDSSSFSVLLPQNENEIGNQLTSTLESATADADDDRAGSHNGTPVTPHIRGAERTRPRPREFTPSILETLRKGPPGSCDICGRTETSVWRKLPLAGDVLKVCNGEI